MIVAACVLSLGLAASGLVTARHIYADMKLQRATDPSRPTRFSGSWRKAALNVLVIGDSRVARWAPLPAGEGMALAFSGSGGETSHELFARFDRQVRSLSPAPDVVVIVVGVNDIVAAQLNPSKAAQLTADLSRNVGKIAEISKKLGARPVIVAIGQAGPIDWRRRLMGIDASLYVRIHDANMKLQSTAQRSGAAWFDVNEVFAATPTAGLPKGLAVDTLHWNEKAYQKINSHLIRKLES